MKRPLVLWLVLVITWLLLNGTVAFGHILLGAFLAWGVVLAVSKIRPLQPRIRNPQVIVRLLFVVLVDIIRSNVGVGRVILGMTGDRKVTAGFMHIPLEMRDPHGLAALSMIVTATPGTVWADFNEGTGVLTLHVLDLQDPEYWIDTIKNRYERPLMEIFE